MLGVNTSFRATECDIIYACDRRWWKEYAKETAHVKERWTQDQWAASELGLKWIEVDIQGKGLSTDRRKVNGGKNGGYQAIGLAYHFDAKKIVLVGFDMKNAGQHWHGDHPYNWGNALGVDDWVKGFYDLAKDLEFMGVEVINCTIDTALNCFKRDTLEGVFSEL